MSGSADWQHLVDETGRILRETAREVIRNTGRVDAKHTDVAGDLVTEADNKSQDRLERELSRLTPEARILGEEGFEATSELDAGLCWVLDPLDGTLNFACDLPFYGMSAALLVNSRPVLGVVYDIGADCLFDATADGPARCDGEAFTHDETKSARAPVGISSGFLADMRAHPEQYAPDWLGSRFRIFGSQAVQLCWAAQGRLRLNINREAKLWDDAAGALICQRSGAAHAALSCVGDALYPLSPRGAALAGKSIFSVSGPAELVAQCRDTFKGNEG